MTNLKGINFDIDIDTQLSELKYLHSMDLIYDDYIEKVYNVYYNNDYDFAIYTVDGIELHDVGTIDSCEFVFSFDYCNLYKIKDAVFISMLSTALSFLLLSFTSFKLISTLGLTLFIGITTSYIASLFMIKSKHD